LSLRGDEVDISCLIGLCTAMAQTVDGAASAAAAAGVAASAANAANAASAAASSATEGWRDDASTMLFVALLCVVAAHALTNTLVKRYEKKMVELMNEDSSAAFAGAMPGTGDFTAESLLKAIDGRRRAMLIALIGIVGLYAIAATVVMRLFGPDHGSTRVGIVHDLTSLMLFASVSAPVVLLGVSASNFERLFWRWCAPPTFVAVALQAALIYEPTDTTRLLEVGGALVALVLLTATVLFARRWLMPQLAGRGWRRLGGSAWGSAMFTGVSAFAAFSLVFIALPAASIGRMAIGALVGGIAIGLMWFALIDRIRRIVAPLLAMSGFAAISSMVGMSMLLDHALPNSPLGALALTLLAGAVTLYFVLSWVGLAHEQKVFSDAQFQVFCWLLTAGAIVVVFTALATPETHSLDAIGLYLALLGCTGLALLAYWAVVRYGIQPLPTNRRLLVLRVFSAHRSGERLLDELEEYWRTIGPIMLIGGTDVAKRTIDPAKAANFVRRRLDDICVPNLFMLVKRIEGMDELPDPDGRYRVNEFFCTKDLWKQAVARLLSMSDAIVLDLTEFTAKNGGTAWELGLLSQRGALARTVCMVSAQTDLEAVRRVLRLPPGSPLPAGSVIEIECEVNGRRLVEALLQRLPPVPLSRPVPAELPLDDLDLQPADGGHDAPGARPAPAAIAPATA
jgi:hypothetical protein